MVFGLFFIIPVLNTGPVHEMCPNEPFSFHKKIRPVSIVKSELPGYNANEDVQSLKKWLAPASVLLWLQTIFSAPVQLT